MKRLPLYSLTFSILLIILTPRVYANTLWEVQAIDTMKYSRDSAKNPKALALIPQQVKAVANSGANYITINTPYDEEFVQVLQKWVNEARKHKLHVWFRGNFSGWEGWFSYPKMTNYQDHHTMTLQFIQNNPQLFMDGDIFTPVPEPENGVIGDPRDSDQKAKVFNQFLIDSYDNCQKAFGQIKKQILCGYFSTNGDIAKKVLTKQTIKHLDNIIVIDHYVKSDDIMQKDLRYLRDKLDANIVIGEFGAPILDIHGAMTEEEQATFIKSLLYVFYKNRSFIKGINYWVLLGGSTSLLNLDFTPRKIVPVIEKFFKPAKITGVVRNTLNEPLENIEIIVNNSKKIKTNKNGEYSFALLEGDANLIFSGNTYKKISKSLQVKRGITNDLSILLEPKKPNILYQIRLFFKKLF